MREPAASTTKHSQMEFQLPLTPQRHPSEESVGQCALEFDGSSRKPERSDQSLKIPQDLEQFASGFTVKQQLCLFLALIPVLEVAVVDMLFSQMEKGTHDMVL